MAPILSLSNVLKFCHSFATGLKYVAVDTPIIKVFSHLEIFDLKRRNMIMYFDDPTPYGSSIPRKYIVYFLTHWTVALVAWITCADPFGGDAPDSKVYRAKMGPTWDRQDQGWPRVGPMNLAISGSMRHN